MSKAVTEVVPVYASAVILVDYGRSCRKTPHPGNPLFELSS